MADDISLLQEIDDAVRADRLLNFWKRNGKLVLAGCAAVVVLTAASTYWKSHLREQQQAHTQQMLKAGALTASANYAEAPALLQQGSVPAASVSVDALYRADLYFKAGQREKAVDALQALAQSPKADQAMKDMASLRLHMQTGEKGTGGAESPGRPFSVLAGELKAAQLLEEGKNKEAAELLKATMKDMPPFSNERERAADLLQLTGVNP